MTISSPTTTSSRKPAALPARPAISTGQKIDGGNIFEGPRKDEYPNPPMIAAQNMVMFEKAARNLGYHPFPNPSSNASRDYVNPGWRGLRPVSLLRLLRAFRLRGERQG